MNIQPMGGESAALYLTAEDLAALGTEPDALTPEQARQLTREAFRQAGLALEGAVEIEAYPERRGVMLFIHGAGRLPARPVLRRPMRRQRVRRHRT